MSVNSHQPIVVISGPSGSGKSTIVKQLIEASPVPLLVSTSATTRPARPGEIAGVDYHFLTHEDFQQKLAEEAFLEHAEVHRTGYFYGTLRSELDRAYQQGAWPLLEIDVEGAMNVVNQYPHALTIFIRTPSPEVFEQRLRDRGTEDEAGIQKRLRTAEREMTFADRYRYQVVNDQLSETVAHICEILQHEQEKTHA